MATLIDGKTFSTRICDHVRERVADLRERGAGVPGLATVLVGEDPASEVYVRNKARLTEETGMASFRHRLRADVSQHDLLSLLARLNADENVHGILVQLPLPVHVDVGVVLNAIDPAKDVDGFHVSNVGLMVTGQKAMPPCTPLGCLLMLRDLHGSLRGKHAVVVGRSNIVGRPMAQLLLADDCTVTMAHRHTENLSEICRQADILVVAVGKAKLVPGDWIKPGATVIDVGINRIEADGRPSLVGDVDFPSASLVAGAITPVPGGVGPMTIACLLLNTLTAFCRAHGLGELEENGLDLARDVGILREFRQSA